MKRLHVNLTVTGLEASVRFYTSLFGARPTVLENDYAKWILEDPRVNFAITTRGTRKGIDHLGIQVENEDELDELYARLNMAGEPVIQQGETTCCYAHSEKSWIFDPEGIPWETFLTRGESPVFGSDETHLAEAGTACCARPERTDAQTGLSCCAGADTNTASKTSGCCA